MYAFRCVTCGKLHEAEHAGECEHPHACRVCGSGVSFDPKSGVKAVDPKNWEVLANATPGRLAELGLREAARHVPRKVEGAPTEPRKVERSAADGASGKDVA